MTTPHNVPSSGTVKFVGRTEVLETLYQQLRQNDKVVIASIEGMGGVGKTELAIQYALRHIPLQTYPGGICWLRARDEEIGGQIVRFAVDHFRINPPEDRDLPGQVAFCWSRWHEGNVLVVLDDVNDYARVEPYLPPQPSRFKMLITTRLQLDLPQSLTLDVLDEDAALDLLRQWVGEERMSQEATEAKQLCQRLGYLPLALQLVGRHVQKRKLSLKDMLLRLEKKGLRHPALARDEKDRTWTLNIKRGVAAAFELSWEELSEEAQQLGYLLSLFALAPIPWKLIAYVKEEQSSEDIEDAKVELNSLHLIQGDTLYHLHQLIRGFFQEKVDQIEQRDDIKRAVATAISKLASQIPQAAFLTYNQFIYFRSFVPHLEEVAKSLVNYLNDSNDLYVLFTGLGNFYRGQGFYKQAELWFEQCLTLTKYKDSEHPNITMSLNNLAYLYQTQGRYEEAEPLYQEALTMRKRLFGEEETELALILNNLALLYQAQGRYEEAEPIFQEALLITKELFGEEHSRVALILNNLAYLYQNQLRYKEAESLYQEALPMAKHLLGEEHSRVALILNNLALLYQAQGRYEEAESLFNEALTMRERLFGEEHPYVATSLHNLALLYQTQARYEEAEPLYKRALAIQELYLV